MEWGLWAKYLLPCYHVAECDMHYDLIMKKLNFELLTPSPGSARRVVKDMQENIYYYVAACVTPFNLTCNMTIF